MRARSVAVFALIFSAVLLFTAIIIALSLPLHAQSPARIPSASPAPALPADVQAGLEKLQADLKAAQDKGDAGTEAKTLNAIGDLYFGVSAYQQALDNYNLALTQARTAKDAEQEAAALNGIGGCYRSQSQNDKAVETYQQALDLATASGNLRGQATALNGIGWVDSVTGQFQKALQLHNRALPLAQKVEDEDLEATILRRMGFVYWRLGEQQKALDSYNQALPICRRIGDRDGEARVLINIGIVYNASGELQKALAFFNQALPIVRQVGDRNTEAMALLDIGDVYYTLSEPQKAIESFNQALLICRQIGDRNDEANLLLNIGNAYQFLSEPQKALDFLTQALPILRQVGDHDDEARTLVNVGRSYDTLGELQKALDSFNQALPVFRQIGDREGECGTLFNIATAYLELGGQQKALDNLNQALLISRQVGDRDFEARTLYGIGAVYFAEGDFQKALDQLNQGLQIYRQVGNRDGEAAALNDIGVVYYKLGELQKALDFYNQALPVLRQVGDRDDEAETLNNMGNVYSDLDEKQKALEYFNHALPLATAVSDPLMEASVFHSLMLNQQGRQPSLAIFYGKQAVNFVQQVRGNVQSLGKELQKSFLASKGDYYHDLANLLIAQGRLPEAQQVLDLLKQQEYRDYVRGQKIDPASSLSLTPAERQAEEDYQKSTTQLVSLGEQWSDLKKIATRSPEQEKQFQRLSDQLTRASQGMNDYYARLYTLFGNNSGANKQVADVKGDVSLLKQTIARMPHTVALYTLVAKDRYSVIVITGPTALAREYAIAEKDLNQKVAAFQLALRDPHSDVKPIGEELYRILIGPVKAELDQAQAQTLVWSLDGALRYVPIAALYDGKHYIVENYSTVTITPASIPRLSDQPNVSNLSAVAMGISRKYEQNLPALPAVVGELDEIVKDAQIQGANGVMPGTILLNGAFTEKAMETQLGGQHSVVHIASHFVFQPGDDSQSYLLLAGKDAAGAGFRLTVADFRDNQNLSLDDTDLLTLSACETGMSGSASNGREVDGLGTTAQLKGAKAVISSLWEVNDASTGALMADFYKRWADGGGKVTKAEALRQAQLDLLQGKVTPQSGVSGRGFTTVQSQPGQQHAQAGYAHPYYWAAFVLMGNWR